jgi:hypothetical protein
MAEDYVFEYEVTDQIIAEAAEAVLSAGNAGRPPARLRPLVFAEALVCLQLLAGLIAGLALGAPAWILVTGGSVLLLLMVWTGLLAFTIGMYPYNRRRYERLIREGYQKLDSPWIRFRLTADGFVVESRTTFREVAWADVPRAFVGRTFWILDAPPHRQLLLPVSALPGGAERFLLDRLTQAGSKIRLEKDHPLDRRTSG